MRKSWRIDNYVNLGSWLSQLPKPILDKMGFVPSLNSPVGTINRLWLDINDFWFRECNYPVDARSFTEYETLMTKLVEDENELAFYLMKMEFKADGNI